MRAVVQRVDRASVTVEGSITGQIDKGLLVLLGVAEGDTEKDLAYIVDKVCGLRIFEDEAGKMNLSVQDVGGSILAVSQFTLCGDCRKGSAPALIRRQSRILPTLFMSSLWLHVGPRACR